MTDACIVCSFVDTFIKLRPAVWMEWDDYLGPTFYFDRHRTREITDWAKRKHVVKAFNTWLDKRDKKPPTTYGSPEE